MFSEGVRVSSDFKVQLQAVPPSPCQDPSHALGEGLAFRLLGS